MPDHIHLLIQGKNIINFIRLFKGRLTPIARSIEAGQKLWQRSFFDHAIRKEDSLHNVACYIWENPIRAKIIDEPMRYRWFGQIGRRFTARGIPKTYNCGYGAETI